MSISASSWLQKVVAVNLPRRRIRCLAGDPVLAGKKGVLLGALNTIVVSQQSGMPGEGFPEDLSPVEIKVEQGKVFLFDWSGHDKPRPDDFQAAAGAN